MGAVRRGKGDNGDAPVREGGRAAVGAVLQLEGGESSGKASLHEDRAALGVAQSSLTFGDDDGPGVAGSGRVRARHFIGDVGHHATRAGGAEHGVDDDDGFATTANGHIHRIRGGGQVGVRRGRGGFRRGDKGGLDVESPRCQRSFDGIRHGTRVVPVGGVNRAGIVNPIGRQIAGQCESHVRLLRERDDGNAPVGEGAGA